jgi:hypothetical protein
MTYRHTKIKIKDRNMVINIYYTLQRAAATQKIGIEDII